MNECRTRIGKGGRVVIPAPWRHALRVDAGDEVLLVLEEDSIRVLTPAQAVRRAQAIVWRHVPAGRRLSEELVAERRREAEGE